MLRAALAAVVLGCLSAPVAFGDPPPNFTWAPLSPIACEEVTFAPSGIPNGETVTWDYDTGTPDSLLTHTFTTEGTHPVTMSVTNGSPVTHDVVVGNAPPVASFTHSPTYPDPGEWIVFTSTSTDCGDSMASASFEWDFGDGSTSTEPNPVHKFDNAGSYNVSLTVTDGDLAADEDVQRVDVGAVPTAHFDRSPGDSVLLETGQPATFTSDSTASANNSITSWSWDVDGDGFDDGTDAVLTHSFDSPGTKVVRLRVVQTNGESDVAESTFRVNAPPVPGFVWAPGSPVAGDVVQLFSTSVDAEGALADQSQAWDLDGDGEFDDAVGPSATPTFTAGDHQVSLRVTDGDGVSRTITRTITVAAPVVPAGPSPATPVTPALMKPFPTVRLVGVVLPRGARITLVEVRGGPRGARVTVRCTGKGCPFKSRRRVAETGRLRLTDFAHFLAAGARIEVFVRAPNVIGRYVGFRIRAGKPPVRTDLCLMPGASKPTRCT